jgi:hypothetical protein
MRWFLFVYLYGLTALTGMFLFVFWGYVARNRARVLDRAGLLIDRYFWAASGIALVGLGLLVEAISRAWGNIEHGLSPILRDGIEGIAIAVGLAITLAGATVLVWLADLERERPRWLWGMGFMALSWAWACLWIGWS